MSAPQAPQRRSTTVMLEEGTNPTTDPTMQPPQRSNTADTAQRQGMLARVATGLQDLAKPQRPVGQAPNWTTSFRAAILSSWINVLLVFIPISWAAHFAHLSDTLTFVFAFLAIVPLASLLSFATEEMAMRVGSVLGGLLNATLGNVTELIVAILALVKCEIRIVQSSLVGSILSNMLLVLGCCFLYGGAKYSEQTVMSTAAQLNASLLQISVLAMLIPAGFHFAFTSSGTTTSSTLSPEAEADDVLKMSRGVAVILLVLYVAYLVFQMFSHADLYEDKPSQSTRYPEGLRVPNPFNRQSDTLSDADGSAEKEGWRSKLHLRKKTTHEAEGTSTEETGEREIETAAGVLTVPTGREARAEEDEEEEVPQMNLWVTTIVMCVVAGLIGYTAEVLVDSISGLTAANPSLSQEWVGLILLPICGNAAEHVTAVTVAGKDKLDLAMGVAIGSSIQIALFVVPLLVIIGWWIGKPLTMLQDPFETLVLFLSVLIVNQTLSDSKSNWLEGFLLVSLYIMIAVAFWYYPGSDPIIAC